MPILNRIADYQTEMTEWRRDIHAHPEIRFEEHRTAALVADKLRSWGIEVHTGIAETGVVGVLRGQGSGSGAVALRADMDALPMTEEGDPPHKSTIDGKMHACGHDGHTTMLLGAAKYLAETRNFDGTVTFIFQPAEEGGGGANRMIEEGLFDRFPADSVWGMHNAPHMPAGTFGLRPGPVMAAADGCRITIRGRGAHAARPQDGIDPIAIGMHIYSAMQTIVSRNVDPIDQAVVTIAQFHAGEASNVIPSEAWMTATIRCFEDRVRDLVEERVRAICAGAETMFGCAVDLVYRRGYPPVRNEEDSTAFAQRVATEVVGEANVNPEVPKTLGAEDFAYYLQKKPGSFLWIGQGAPGHDYGLHHPKYDFNDEVLGVGASFFARLVETRLPRTD